MKTFNFIFFIFFIFYFNTGVAFVINEEIFKKYNDIFSEKLLSKNDVKNYQEIFKLQEDCEWKKANKLILLVQNKVLMGHVLAERYLHPRCYKSKFKPSSRSND